MRLRKMLIVVCILSALLLGFTVSASANSRTAVSIKSGAGVGRIGLEIEHRFENGFAIGVEGGGQYIPMEDAEAWYFQGAVTGRYYFIRGDINPFVSVGAMMARLDLESEEIEGTATVPGVLGTAGVEVMFGRVRVAGELGYGVWFFDEPEVEREGAFTYGVSLGYTF